MRATVSCSTCGKMEEVTVEAPTLAELGEILTSLLVACHATPPHCPHKLKVEFSGQDHVVQERELLIRCISTRCDESLEKELRTTVPRELIGAMTLLFHTSHEGHPMEISYGGRSWRSPV